MRIVSLSNVVLVSCCWFNLSGAEQAHPAPGLVTAIAAIHDKTVAEAAKRLNNPDEHVRIQVIQSDFIEEDPEPVLAEAVPALIALLDDSSADVRWAAGIALGRFGSKARAAVPKLCSFTTEQNWVLRSAAAQGLGGIACDANVVLPKLQALLDDSQKDVVKDAVIAIGRFGKDAAGCADRFAEMARTSKDVPLALAAAVAHWRCSRSVEVALPVLTKLLDSRDDGARMAAALAISEIGPEAKDAVPALVTALRDQSPYVQMNAVNAVAEIGPAATEAVPALERIMKSGGIELRALAVYARWRVTGLEGPATVAMLSRLLAAPSPHVIQMGLRLLGDMGPAAQTATDEIRSSADRYRKNPNREDPGSEAMALIFERMLDRSVARSLRHIKDQPKP